MKKIGYLLLALFLVSCVDEEWEQPTPEKDRGIGQMVLFSAGNAENILSRASVPYMAQDGRFVCRMYYHSKQGDANDSPFDVALPEDHGTQITAWLKVNNGLGNSIYWNPEYNPVAAADQNEYGEKAAQAFYWQNRLFHAFLAVADYNQLKTNKFSAGLKMDHDLVREIETNASEKRYQVRKIEITNQDLLAQIVALYPGVTIDVVSPGTHTEGVADDDHQGAEYREADGYYYQWTAWENYQNGENGPSTLYRIYQRVTSEKVKKKFYAKKYDLTRDTKTAMNQQPDPIQALTLKKPEGATQEANRVNLFFKHQFSQIQVNIKNSSDANDIPIGAEHIISAELLGISREGYVYVQLEEDGTVHATDAQVVNKQTCPQSLAGVDWDNNEYGTSFLMFNRTLSQTETDLGYFKSYEAIAFGRLEGIRLVWKEPGTNVAHHVVYQIPDEDLKTLQSGYRYIYNMELRRGTLALVRTAIKDWAVDETDYGTNGIIGHNGLTGHI